jgi:magnesium-transporting ATPase (P-type)
LSTLSHEEICRTWKHAHIKLEKTAKHCFANYEVRALSVIFWFCFTSAILLMLGTILVYMYWQLPPVWFYVWSSFSGMLVIIFIPLLTLRLYRTITGTDLILS